MVLIKVHFSAVLVLLLIVVAVAFIMRGELLDRQSNNKEVLLVM